MQVDEVTVSKLITDKTVKDKYNRLVANTYVEVGFLV